MATDHTAAGRTAVMLRLAAVLVALAVAGGVLAGGSAVDLDRPGEPAPRWRFWGQRR